MWARMDYNDWDAQKLTSRNDLTVSQNIELRTLLNDCNRLACAGNLLAWRWKLDAIERELNFDTVKLDDNTLKDKKSYETQLEESDNEISKNLKNKFALYKLLQHKEKILRTIQEESGKGTKRVFDDDDDD